MPKRVRRSVPLCYDSAKRGSVTAQGPGDISEWSDAGIGNRAAVRAQIMSSLFARVNLFRDSGAVANAWLGDAWPPGLHRRAEAAEPLSENQCFIFLGVQQAGLAGGVMLGTEQLCFALAGRTPKGACDTKKQSNIPLGA